ncbi:type II secretion system protein [Haladaptatus sp. AB618]|uniref:type II secretion system protein n=1 Tax=Haladaptatus sp. AB618 TaxID=2934173 RepID=UPI00209C2FB8|nr:type II secretion system protein [Haladaptatus sp. AB618]
MILESFETLCSSLARLYPWQVTSDADIDRAMGFLNGNVGSREVARAANAAAILGCLVGVISGALAEPALRFVVGGLSVALAVGVSASLRRVPELLAAAKRTQALGDAPDLVARAVLWMRIEPTAEGAAAFASRTGDGSLASSLGDHVRRAAGSPTSGLTSFAAEWESWNPALHRSMVLIAAASEAPAGERKRTLDRALTAILDGTRERMAEFVTEIRGPATALYAFGVLLPLALVAVLPAAKTAGVPMSPAVLVVGYDVLLPALLLGASVWLLTRRPVTFPPPDVSRSHPDVPDERWPVVALGLGAAGVALIVTTLLLPNWTRWIACGGCLVGALSVGSTRSTVRIRNHVRAVESGVTDALYLVGRRVNEGQAVEAAIIVAGDELSGETGAVFDRATRIQRQLGMGVKESFLGEYGALSTVPSPRARSATALLALAASEGRPAGGAVVAMADHIDDLQRVEREARRELSQVTETLRHTAAIFGPLVSGATVALAGEMASVGGSFGGGGAFPVGVLGLAVGVYVLFLSTIITTLAVGLEHGLDRTLVGYRVGQSLLSATVVYLLAFVLAGALT